MGTSYEVIIGPPELAMLFETTLAEPVTVVIRLPEIHWEETVEPMANLDLSTTMAEHPDDFTENL